MIPVGPYFGFTREHLLACLDRELALRDRVYPRLVDRGQMSFRTAQEELARLRAVRAVIASLPPVPAAQQPLFDGGGR